MNNPQWKALQQPPGNLSKMKSILQRTSCILIVILFSSITTVAKETVPIPIGTPALINAGGVIRQTFNALLHTQMVVPQAVWVQNAAPYILFFNRKFIVLKTQAGDFGGFWATILIDPENMKIWRLWLSPYQSNKYQIRSIEEIPLTSKERGEFTLLLRASYKRDWQ